MIGLFPHHLRALRLRLRRVCLETLAGRARLPLEHPFLGELDHVTEPAVFVGWRILDVPAALAWEKEWEEDFAAVGDFAAGAFAGRFDWRDAFETCQALPAPDKRRRGIRRRQSTRED